jgi:putative ABC transport system permease protein
MFWRKRKQADFSAEIEAHLQLEIERLRERGLSAADAETAARLRFGNVTRVEERFYESGRWLWWERLKQDVRFGLRMLKRNPAFSVVAVLTLALGIGANTAIFSLIQAVLLRPLPFPEPDRLVRIWERRPSSREANLPISGHEFAAWKEQSHVFEKMALFTPGGATITGAGEPEQISLMRVSADFFPVLGVQPVLGRTILPGEDRAGKDRVAVLSDGLWRRRFSADRKIVGQAITLNDETYAVVGVMPYLPESMMPDLWLPIDLPAEVQRVGRHGMNVIARLKPGVTLEQAQSDLAVVARALEQQRPRDNTDHKVSVLALREDLAGDMRRALVMLMGSVGFVLLIACLNVASLLLTRAAGRQREMAIRTALGASRLRLIRQLVTESLLLSAMGGILGLVLAVWLVRLLPHIQGVSIPLVETIAVDRPVLLVTALLSLLSGLAAGVAPALRASRTRSVAQVSEGRRISAEPERRRLGAAMVATQVALALILLVGAGLLMKSFVRLVNVDTGFNTQHVLVTSVALSGAKYPHAEQSRGFFDALLERIKALPGVQSVGGTTNLPLQGTDNWSPFSIEGRPAPPPGRGLYAPLRVVSPGYFQTLGIPLRAGRFFGPEDARVAVPLIRWYEQQPNPANFDQPQPVPAAIISDAMARQYWPGENPLGRRFRVLFSPWITIVGVVGDVKHNSLDAPYYPHIYLPYMQEPSGEMTLVIRTAGDPMLSANAVREQIRGMDAGLPVAITEMNQVLSGSVGRQRFYVLLAGVFGALALGLAVVGIFGLASYSVSQRIGEIGLRMALGAQRSDILWMILGQGMLPTLAGAVLGSGGALALAVLIKSFLYQVSPDDPVALVAALLLITPIALIASYIPARRAMRVDPNVALRCE